MHSSAMVLVSVIDKKFNQKARCCMLTIKRFFNRARMFFAFSLSSARDQLRDEKNVDLIKKVSAKRSNKRTPSPLVFLAPQKNEALPAHPRVKWYSLAPLATNMRVELVIRNADDNTELRYDLDRSNDFLIPAPLPDGNYRFRLRALRGNETITVSRWQPVHVRAMEVSNRDRVLCRAAWHRLYIGQIRANPCCRLREGYGNPYNFDVPGMDPLNADGLTAIREALMHGDSRYCTPTCSYLNDRAQNADEARLWYSNVLRDSGIPDGSEEFARRLDAFVRGHLVVEGPIDVKISLGSPCNHRCTFCPVGSKSYNHWYQEPAVFDYLADNIDSIRSLTLTGGEPLALIKEVSSRFQELFQQESKLRELRIQTNGALLHRQLDLLRHVPKLALSVSIAGGSREAYAAIHRRDDFDKVVSNLEQLRTLREEDGKDTFVELKMVFTRSNYHTLPGLFDIAKRVHADKILYHHVLYLGASDLDKNMQPREDDDLWPHILEMAEYGYREAERLGLEFEFRPLNAKKNRQGNQYDPEAGEE